MEVEKAKEWSVKTKVATQSLMEVPVSQFTMKTDPSTQRAVKV